MREITLAEFEALQQKYAQTETADAPPQIEEHTSGLVQQLQATPQAVAYKNFAEDQIEETTLLKDGLNQHLSTNLTETYAPGITSTLNETAPSINHQVILEKSHSLTVKNRVETVQSQQEIQNINVTDWKVYHKTFTQNIPTKLTHQVTQSSQVTIDKYQGNIDVQRINAETYTHNFGTQTFNGPMQIRSNSSIAIRGKNIIFGPDTSALSASIRTCNPVPTPAPKNILGTCQYYKWRYNDFMDRHVNCQHDKDPPKYYLQYGFPFCQLFSTELKSKMTPPGQAWIERARLNLQLDLEKVLQQNGMIEINNQAFYEAAFNTHDQAYLDAGFLNLSEHDVVQFLDVGKFVETFVIPSDIREFALQHIGHLGKLYFVAHAKSKYGPVVGAVEELTVEGADAIKAWGGTYIDWLHTHKIYYLDPFNS